MTCLTSTGNILDSAIYLDKGIIVDRDAVHEYGNSRTYTLPENSAIRVGDEVVSSKELALLIKVMRKIIAEDYPEELL